MVAGDNAGQLTDQVIEQHQLQSALCSKMRAAGERDEMKTRVRRGVLSVLQQGAWKVVLPPSLWPRVFRECHDSVWRGHLRKLQTLARIRQMYLWPRMSPTVNDWVDARHDCGSRKVRAPQVVVPLRSLGAGAVGDR
ncbi:hypothetical protein PybrP1_004485 [[Pythium] brassicae (nom. inval.)]|nr:hypothetical protein PybrP1_004485 [[Pythium] brassicae (nom. inval.)]